MTLTNMDLSLVHIPEGRPCQLPKIEWLAPARIVLNQTVWGVSYCIEGHCPLGQ
jgi:hypothetical protein